MSDLISIIVPVYNASKYLEQCIESILVQTYKELQIILIDDGSTDESLKICRQYQRQDNRIKTISQSNGGSVSARKAGLRIATGTYIGFVDADDYIEPDMFERLHEKLKEYNADFIHSGMITNNKKFFDYEDGIVDFTIQNRAEFIRENVFRKQKIFNALWSKLFKADLVKKAFLSLPDEQCFGEDLLCMCNYLSECRRFYLLKDAFYHYRVYDGSLSHVNWLDLCIKEAKLYEYVLRRLEDNDLISECGDSVKYRYKQRILSAMEWDKTSGISVAKYVFGDIDILSGKRVILYGAGNVGRDFYYQITRYGLCELVAWVDKVKYGVINLITVEKPEKIKELQYDIIVFAVKDKQVAMNMKEDLLRAGINDVQTKAIWQEPIKIW